MRKLPQNPEARRRELDRRWAVKSRKLERIAAKRLNRQARADQRQALRAWTQLILNAGQCAICGFKSGPKVVNGQTVLIARGRRKGQPVIIHLNAHHVLPKETYPWLRTDLANGICLCPEHHRFGKFSAHRNPIWFAHWLRINKPEQHDWALTNLHYSPIL